jgi:hypothetical protein
MVAASVAVLALIGGLIFAGTRADEDLVPADQPVPTVPADPVDEADPEVSTPLEPDADATRPTSGTISGGLDCSHGPTSEDVELNRRVTAQSCPPDPDNAGGPFPNEFVERATIIELNDPGLPVDVPATQFVRITTTGDISAGLLTTNDDRDPDARNIRLVGIAAGANDYEGVTIHTSSRFLASNDAGSGLDWYIDDGSHTIPNSEVVELTSNVTITCEGVLVDDGDPTTETYDQTCNYVGADARLVPQPNTQRVVIFEADESVEAIDGTRYITMVTDSGTIRAGIIDRDGVIRFVGMTDGSGELEGTLVHELAWGQADARGGITAEGQIFTLPGN